MNDLQLRDILFSAADTVGVASKRSGFVTLLNEGQVTYPLFLLTPVVSRQGRPTDPQVTYRITAYFMLHAAITTSDGRLADPNEDEVWAKYSEAADMSERFLNALHAQGNPVTDITSERNAFQLGTDETVYIKLDFNLITFKSC